MSKLLVVNAAGQLDINAGRVWLENDKSWMVQNGKVVPAPLHVNALLQKQEWVKFDEATKAIMGVRLSAVADLKNAGLIWNAGNLGTSIAEWDASSDMTDADVNMSGTVGSEKDNVGYTTSGVPIPIIRKDFSVSLRRLLASRNLGASVDVTSAQVAARKVAERSEDLLFNGVSISVGGYTVYGYSNHPQRNTGALAYDWNLAGTTGKNILSDVRRMKLALQLDQHYGPYTIYVGGTYWAKLSEDYSDTKGDNTILQRILAEEGIVKVSVSDKMADDAVVMVQLTSDVIDLAVAQDVSTVQWDSGDGMMANFATLVAWAPRIKTDFDSRLGIAHYTWTSV